MHGSDSSSPLLPFTVDCDVVPTHTVVHRCAEENMTYKVWEPL